MTPGPGADSGEEATGGSSQSPALEGKEVWASGAEETEGQGAGPGRAGQPLSKALSPRNTDAPGVDRSAGPRAER